MDYYKLITPATLKVLGAFKREKRYFNQIAELARMKSRSNLLSALRKLVTAHVLKEEKTKGNTFYSLNLESRITIALLAFMNISKLYNLPFERRKAIEEVSKESKAATTVLFGSTAKGNFQKESDIDLLLVYHDALDMPFQKRIKNIVEKYGVTINAVMITARELEKPNDSIKHILETGYPVSGHLYFYDIYKRT